MTGKPRNAPAAWALAGGLVSLVLALALFDPFLFTGGDNAAYYALTKALGEGRGYVDLVHPGAPPETQYPPGFPLLLVPLYWLSGGSMMALKLGSIAAGGVLLWAVWALARRDPAVPGWAAAAAVWLVGLYPVFLAYTHWVLSDMAFTAIVMVALWAFADGHAPSDQEGGEEPGGEIDPRWIGACAIAVAAFYVRIPGAALLLAAAIVPAIHGLWKRAGAAAAVAVLGTLPWILWTRQGPPETGGYLDQLLASNPQNPESPSIGAAGLVGRVLHNVGHYATVELPRLFWPADPPDAIVLLALPVGAGLIVYGAVRAIRTRGIAVADAWAAITLALLAVWPWIGDRFFLTVVPLLWLYTLVGMDHLSRRVADTVWPARIAAAALAAVLLAGAALQAPDRWKRLRDYLDGRDLAGYSARWQDYFLAAEWVGDNAPDAVILARKPSFAWYWSRRPSLVYPFHGDPDRTWEFLREHGVTHILLDPGTELFLRQTLRRHVERVELDFAAPHRIVYVARISPPEAP
ncbi:MAG: hypothetical protein R3199_00760 [Gemmatimonadota bacterium]|nr:hypothetical protein [Gemmatimonadota bacterium]